MMSLSICIAPPTPSPLFPLRSYRGGRGIPPIEARSRVLSCRRMVREVVVDIYQRIVVHAPDPQVTAGQPDAFHRAVGEPHFFPLSKVTEGEL
jgi:hypothetical protein